LTGVVSANAVRGLINLAVDERDAMPAYRPPTETTFLNGHQETEPFPYAGLFHLRR